MRHDEPGQMLFLDIETVPLTPTLAEMPERLRKLWPRKAQQFRRDPSVTDDALFLRSAGIFAEFGKVIVVATGRLRQSTEGDSLHIITFSGHDERNLLFDLAAHLGALEKGIRLCAHNGKEFDFPFLARRMLVHGIPLPDVLDHAGRKPWEVPHVDTMELWKFGDHKHYTSLEQLAALFDIPGSKGDMDGSQVREVYYEHCDLPRITRYCAADLLTLARVYARLTGGPNLSRSGLLSPDQITIEPADHPFGNSRLSIDPQSANLRHQLK